MTDHARSDISCTPLTVTTVMRLKALPASSNSPNPVTLAGRTLPARVGATDTSAWRTLCIGPQDWLLVSQDAAATSMRDRHQSEIVAQALVLVDLSDGLVVLDARGAAVRQVLWKVCGLDFHSNSFPVGSCARTRLAQIPVVIDCPSEPLQFYLYVARSYLHYLHSWLTDASIEFREDRIREAAP